MKQRQVRGDEGDLERVMVWTLTFTNAVSCITPEVQTKLEIKQPGERRFFLKAQGKTPNQGLQGDMRCSSFGGREASSKIEFEDRLRGIDSQRLA